MTIRNDNEKNKKDFLIKKRMSERRMLCNAVTEDNTHDATSDIRSDIMFGSICFGV